MNRVVLTALGLSGIVAAAGLSLAPSALADEYDYLGALDANGVYYKSTLDIIDQGKLSCHIMRLGQTQRAAMDSAVRAGYSVREAATIVVYAAKDMCPDQFAKVSDTSGASHY